MIPESDIPKHRRRSKKIRNPKFRVMCRHTFWNGDVCKAHSIWKGDDRESAEQSMKDHIHRWSRIFKDFECWIEEIK